MLSECKKCLDNPKCMTVVTSIFILTEDDR